MSNNVAQGDAQPSTPQNTPASGHEKEINLAKQRMYYEKLLAEKELELNEARKKHEAKQPVHVQEDDDDDDEPYVDKRKLQKKLEKFGQHTMQQTQSEIQKAVQLALNEERKQNWLKQNGDFYDVLKHAEKLAQKDPELAETILEMPDSFERQKLVYKNIKALNLHLPESKEPSIQEKIDANKKGYYYRPSGTGSAPYASSGDFSPGGQKQAYEKLLALKKQLRLG